MQNICMYERVCTCLCERKYMCMRSICERVCVSETEEERGREGERVIFLCESKSECVYMIKEKYMHVCEKRVHRYEKECVNVHKK